MSEAARSVLPDADANSSLQRPGSAAPTQSSLFPDLEKDEPETIYARTTAKNLIYEPSGRKPNLEELVDRCKALELQRKIESAQISEKEKLFLRLAAQRHNSFNYDLVADYYAHAGAEMQTLMEESGLVIVDFQKAIELGFVQLSEQIANQYLSESE